MRSSPHVQACRDPLERHRRFRPQACRQLHLPRIAFLNNEPNPAGERAAASIRQLATVGNHPKHALTSPGPSDTILRTMPDPQHSLWLRRRRSVLLAYWLSGGCSLAFQLVWYHLFVEDRKSVV